MRRLSERCFLQPIEAMERVSRKEFCERMDELIEEIRRDQVGKVIYEEGKQDIVLCPSEWFFLFFDDDFGCIINSAVRYAIGRKTYMPSVVINFVKKYQEVLDTKTIENIIKDIDREAGWVPDLYQKEDWLGLKEELIQCQERMADRIVYHERKAKRNG